jgi:hypothetical protein
VTKEEVSRARNIASITPEAKEAAIEAGISDNQSKLLEVAKEKPEKQVGTVHTLAVLPPKLLEPITVGRLNRETNPLVVAWDNAGGKQRHEFILARKAEIIRVQREIERLALETSDDGLDIPDYLKRPAVGAA